MNEYVETQPYWDAATLLVTMGRAKHEMLLFADQGAAGRFTGVPNVVRDGSKFFPKLFQTLNFCVLSRVASASFA